MLQDTEYNHFVRCIAQAGVPPNELIHGFTHRSARDEMTCGL